MYCIEARKNTSLRIRGPVWFSVDFRDGVLFLVSTVIFPQTKYPFVVMKIRINSFSTEHKADKTALCRHPKSIFSSIYYCTWYCSISEEYPRGRFLRNSSSVGYPAKTGQEDFIRDVSNISKYENRITELSSFRYIVSNVLL